MRDTKQNKEPRRMTKNSREVATLEEQNRVLQEVLEASRNHKENQITGETVVEGNKSPSHSVMVDGEDDRVEDGKGDESNTEKGKAEVQIQGSDVWTSKTGKREAATVQSVTCQQHWGEHDQNMS